MDFAGFPPHLHWEGTAALGPILLEENILEVELPAKPAVLIQKRGATSAGVGGGADLATALNFCIAAANGIGDVCVLLSLLSLLHGHGRAVRSGRSASSGAARAHWSSDSQPKAKIHRTRCLYLI